MLSFDNTGIRIPRRILFENLYEGYYLKICFVWIFLLCLWGRTRIKTCHHQQTFLHALREYDHAIGPTLLSPPTLQCKYACGKTRSTHPTSTNIHPKSELMLIVYDITSKLLYWSKFFCLKGYLDRSFCNKNNLD